MTPLSIRDTSFPRYDPLVSDTWPPPGPQKHPPLLEHVRDVWTLHGIQSTCAAAIWRNDFGLELRVEHGGELIESRLSRVGEAPLLLIADQLKASLLEQGWFETPQATEERLQRRARPRGAVTPWLVASLIFAQVSSGKSQR